MCASEKRPLVCVFIPHPSIVSQGDCCTNPSRATKLPTRPTSALENPITFCSATRAVLAAARLSAPTPAQPAKRPAREETAAGAWRISVTLDDCGIGVERAHYLPPCPPDLTGDTDPARLGLGAKTPPNQDKPMMPPDTEVQLPYRDMQASLDSRTGLAKKLASTLDEGKSSWPPLTDRDAE